ncbi:MAG: transglutaminase TgpA family protein [Gammaproteobacteria bacterium]
MSELNPNRILLLLTAAGLAVLPHFTHLPMSLAIWFLCLFAWRLLGVWHPRHLPDGALHYLIILSGIALLYREYSGAWSIETGPVVFIVALSVKLLELDKKRDAYLVGYLIFILTGSLLLFRQNLGSICYGIVICWVLLADLVAVNSDRPRYKTALRRAGIMMCQALPMTAMIFVLFPRAPSPAWDFFKEEVKAQSGLSDTLEPGSINRLALSPKLAFRAKFNGKIPPRNQLYWRGPVFSYTSDGRVWEMSKNDFVVHFQDKTRFRGAAYDYTLLLEPQSRNWVYALNMPAAYDDSLRRNDNYQLTSRTKPGEAAQFSIVSYPNFNTGYITKTEYRENRRLPGAPSERVVDLVRQLQGFEGKPEIFIDRLMTYFREQKFSYSLRPPLMEENFIETFLFQVRSGFCNHYAAAFAYLMRVADIPARVVTGYQGGEFNAVGKFLEIRQANAHAWAEVWLQGKGWVRVDPTTAILPGRIEQEVNVTEQVERGVVSLSSGLNGLQDDRSWLKTAQQIVDSVDYHWQRWFVMYGTENQSLLLAKMGIGSLKKNSFLLVAALAVIMLGLGGRQLWIRPVEDDPALKLYRRFCRKMAKAGIVIRPGEGPADFAVRAKAQKPEYSRLIDEVTHIFVRLRYYPSPSADDLKRLKKRVDALSL